MKTKFKFNIITKLIFGFGVISITFLGSYFYIYQSLTENQELTKKVNNNIAPSMSALNKFSYIVYESKHLIKNWVLYEVSGNTTKKNRLKKINQKIYLETKYELNNLSQGWSTEEQLKIEQILNLADNYFIQQEKIMKSLNSPEKYTDPNFENKYAQRVQDGNPLIDLAENIKKQVDEMYSAKKNTLLSYNVKMENSFLSFSNMIIISGIILIFMIIIITFLFVNSILSPINYTRNIIKSMSSGELPKQKIKTSTDEIGQMGLALNNLISGLKEKANFARDIEKGNFKSYFKKGGKNDILGNSLLAMRDSLAKAAQDEKIRRKENEERSWSTQGITEFNNLIREHSGTPEEFAMVTINKLTRYIKAQVGGFYILNEKNKENIYLELIAFYAYDRHKFFQNKILPGQDLVGQCFLEKDTIFISDIPENYIKISSGLGKDDPKSILIVPLIVNEKVYGIVELASLEILEKYKIEFVEKVSEIFASTIATIQINQQTAQILEESKEKSETLEYQEEESIKNIERLNKELEDANSTVEQLKIQNKELQEKISEKDNTEEKKDDESL